MRSRISLRATLCGLTVLIICHLGTSKPMSNSASIAHNSFHSNIKGHENSNDFWDDREALIKEDLSLMIGSDITLTPDEQTANDILMAAKRQEYDDAFNDLKFPPSKNFFLVKDQIDASSVFSIIKVMPKGAVLHTHDIAMTSIEWVVDQLTYWPHLYMCTTEDGQLLFNFFETPNSDCDWESVEDQRASWPSPDEFDQHIKDQLSLFTEDPTEYEDINGVWRSFEKSLIAISGIVGYKDAMAAYLYQAFLEYSQDGVTYIEFRGTLPQLYELDGTLLSNMETFKIYRDTFNTFVADHTHQFFGVKFIYAPLRRIDDSTMWSIIDTAVQLYQTYPDAVAGFDLVGQEDLGAPLKDFIQQLSNLTSLGIPLFFHAGETAWQGVSTDENLVDAILFNTTRIGHGYAITKHPKLKQLAKERNIPLEVCPVSNQVLMLVEDLRNHPAASLMAEGYPIVISSDDPGTWGADPLSHDFYEAFMGLGGRNADLRFLKKLALNSIHYSSLDENKKIELESMWQGQWDQFISSVNNLTALNSVLHC